MQVLEKTPAAAQRRYNGIRVLRVLRTEMLTAKMKRVVVGGDEIEGFGSGPNIKLLIPPVGLAEPEWPLAGPKGSPIWPEESRRPAVRTYSVADFDARRGELSIDFVLHGKDGPAANWAMKAVVGDQLGVGGPGGRGLRESNWYVLAGDHCALPAIANMLRNLPAGARGRAVIEVPDAGEQQALQKPAGLDVTWLHRNGLEAGNNSLLTAAARSLAWPKEENAFVWIAGESSSVRAIRAYVRDELGVDRRQFLAIGYWRRGMSETAYKKEFNNDRDEDYFKGAF